MVLKRDALLKENDALRASLDAMKSEAAKDDSRIQELEARREALEEAVRPHRSLNDANDVETIARIYAELDGLRANLADCELVGFDVPARTVTLQFFEMPRGSIGDKWRAGPREEKP
jgi:chromosome segregation ATPase